MQIIFPRNVRILYPKSPAEFAINVEKTSFAKNVLTWKDFVAAHVSENGNINFNRSKFEENRYGVNIS